MKAPTLKRFGITMSQDDDFLLTMAWGGSVNDVSLHGGCVKTSLPDSSVVYTFGTLKAAAHWALRINAELAWQAGRKGVTYGLHDVIDSKPVNEL